MSHKWSTEENSLEWDTQIIFPHALGIAAIVPEVVFHEFHLHFIADAFYWAKWQEMNHFAYVPTGIILAFHLIDDTREMKWKWSCSKMMNFNN